MTGVYGGAIAGSSQSPLWGSWEKLNTSAYLTVNFARKFAHVRSNMRTSRWACYNYGRRWEMNALILPLYPSLNIIVFKFVYTP